MDILARVLLAAGALAGLWFWVAYAAAGPSRGKSAVKTVAVGALALAAWRLGAYGAALALALGAAGDFALSRPGNRAFLAGLVAFLVGHLVWAAEMARWPGSDPGRLTGDAAVAALALSAVLAGMTAVLWHRAGPLRGPVALYAAVTGVMGLAALTLPAAHRAQGAATLFILSDGLLAAGLFLVSRDDPRQRALALAVWPAYWAAQALYLWAALSNRVANG